MKVDLKTSEDLAVALDALIATENWLDAEEAIARSSYKGDSTRVATAAHGVFLDAMAKAKPLIEKRRLSKNE
jgi:hypothetical protein